MSTGEDPMVTKLMSKVAEQAKELSNLYTELRDSKKIIESYEKKVKSNVSSVEPQYFTSTNTVSSDAQRRRIEKEHKDQMQALQRQLSISQTRLEESSKQKKNLILENEKLMRELKHNQKALKESQSDVQKLRSKVESFERIYETERGQQHQQGREKCINPIQEIHRVKDRLKEVEHERDQLQLQSEELQVRVKVLEDALEFRADEVGLSGHADLLMKVSHLRGEVTALRRDLQSKEAQVEGLEAEKSTVCHHSESLEQQVVAIRQRLAEAQQDLTRVQKSSDGSSPSLLDQLKAVEQERDLLVEYIQADMQKSSEVGLQLEKCRGELRVAQEGSKGMEQRAKVAEDAAENATARCLKLEKELSSTQARLEEATRMQAVFEEQRNDLSALLERKAIETEELYKIQTKQLEEMKQKDDEREVVQRELRQLRAQYEEQSHSLKSVEREADLLREQKETLEIDVAKLNGQLSHTQPRLSALEPEVSRLQGERQRLLSEKEQNAQDLQRYRELSSQLREIEEELGENGLGSTSESNDGLSLAQKHAAWCGVSSLRRMCPPLYERIRAMFQDLHRTEAEVMDLRTEINQIKIAHERQLQEQEDYVRRVGSSEHELSQQVEEGKIALAACEKEIAELKNAKAVVDQVRSILQSTQKMMREQSVSPSKSISKGSSEHKSHEMRRAKSHDTYGFDANSVYDMEGPIDDVQLEDLASMSIPSPILRSPQPSRSRKSSPSKSLEYVEAIPDFEIPNTLSQMLMHSMNALNRLHDYEVENSDLRKANAILHQKASTAFAENSGLHQSITDTKRHLLSSSKEHVSIETALSQQVEEAAELAEKQNALIMTLEAKLVDMRRKMLLKGAQVTSLQQRETSMQKKLYTSLEKFKQASPFQLSANLPGDDINLPKLLNLVEVFFTDIANIDVKSTQKMLNESRRHANGSVPSPRRPPPRRPQLAEDSTI